MNLINRVSSPFVKLMTQPRSKLLEILLDSPARKVTVMPSDDVGLDTSEPFPFLAIVGQEEMKLALLLSIINPRVGGVLLIGPRGTAKTTAVRALPDLLPEIRRSLCQYGCTEDILEEEGMDGICEDCQKKVGYDEPLTVSDRVRLLELPLNARLDDVVGGVNERIAIEQQRVRLERGILGQADGQLLYIDEVNLLDDTITDAILDAAAQGHYTVRRGPMRLRYRSRFLLIGSMNPEEGRLRPQLMDRFGLRAIVRGLAEPPQRYDAYTRVRLFHQNRERFAASYYDGTTALAEEVQAARMRLPKVEVGEDSRDLGLRLVQHLQIDSNRAEITLFEAARAHAAADERDLVTPEDVQAVALLALRQRRSEALSQYFTEQEAEDQKLKGLF
jgi:magnesium chelatase subunit I